MTGNMRSLVRRMLFFLASVVALYLVVGAAASACYREGSVIDNPVPVRRAEGACPDTQQVTLDVSSGQTSQTGVTLYDGDCNAIEAFLSGTSTLIAPDGSSPTLPSSGAVQSAGLWTCEWSWTGEIGGVNVFTFDVSEGFIIQPFSNLTDWQNPPSMDASLTPAGSILYHQTSTNGYALPASQYSPGVYSSLFVHAIGGFKYPRVGITLWEAKHRLDAWVNSPGYATPMCPGTWTLDIDSITDPLPGLGSGGVVRVGVRLPLDGTLMLAQRVVDGERRRHVWPEGGWLAFERRFLAHQHGLAACLEQLLADATSV